jgi:hypothetical protein
MTGIGPFELLMMFVAGILSVVVPLATLILVILIYRNTRKK